MFYIGNEFENVVWKMAAIFGPSLQAIVPPLSPFFPQALRGGTYSRNKQIRGGGN